MTKAVVIKVETKETCGVQLIDVTFKTNNGIQAVARAQSFSQFQVGVEYYGKLSYAPKSNIRIFSPGAKV